MNRTVSMILAGALIFLGILAYGTVFTVNETQPLLRKADGDAQGLGTVHCRPCAR